MDLEPLPIMPIIGVTGLHWAQSFPFFPPPDGIAFLLKGEIFLQDLILRHPQPNAITKSNANRTCFKPTRIALKNAHSVHILPAAHRPGRVLNNFIILFAADKIIARLTTRRIRRIVSHLFAAFANHIVQPQRLGINDALVNITRPQHGRGNKQKHR